MTNQYFLERIAGRSSNLRAADADRERTAERLRKAHAEGRLDMDEFQQRLERCYESKTYGELGELVNDLPGEREGRERRQSLGSRRWGPSPLAPILIALFVLAVAAGHFGFWLWMPLLVLLFWRMSWRRRWMAGPRHRPNQWL